MALTLTNKQFRRYVEHAEKRYNGRKSVLTIGWDTTSTSDGTTRKPLPKTERDGKRFARLAKVLKRIA